MPVLAVFAYFYAGISTKAEDLRSAGKQRHRAPGRRGAPQAVGDVLLSIRLLFRLAARQHPVHPHRYLRPAALFGQPRAPQGAFGTAVLRTQKDGGAHHAHRRIHRQKLPLPGQAGRPCQAGEPDGELHIAVFYQKHRRPLLPVPEQRATGGGGTAAARFFPLRHAGLQLRGLFGREVYVERVPPEVRLHPARIPQQQHPPQPVCR